jgi:hypothetical protein
MTGVYPLQVQQDMARRAVSCDRWFPFTANLRYVVCALLSAGAARHGQTCSG